jgi:hypothetical protein
MCVSGGHTFFVGRASWGFAIWVHNIPRYRGNGTGPGGEGAGRRGGKQGFKSAQQRKQLEGLKNKLKGQLTPEEREAFKKAIEDEKVGEQFLDKERLQEIFDEIIARREKK